MDRNEQLLAEAVSNMLSDRAALGLDFHKNAKETSHFVQSRHQDIECEFRVRANVPDMNLYEAVTAAFYHTHSYRNIDDPKFDEAFMKQMGDIVPQSDKELALEILYTMRKEIGQDINDFDVVEDLDQMRGVTGAQDET